MAARRDGKQGHKSDKEWRDAIRLAVHRVRDGGDGQSRRALRLLAEKLVTKGLEGDVAALKEIGDRLDGKPTQAIEHGGELALRRIAEEFVMPDGERYAHDQDAPDLPTTH